VPTEVLHKLAESPEQMPAMAPAAKPDQSVEKPVKPKHR
jgi:hypothetical protein